MMFPDSDSVHCTLGAHCAHCRAWYAGRTWRTRMTAGVPDFECPLGRPWTGQPAPYVEPPVKLRHPPPPIQIPVRTPTVQSPQPQAGAPVTVNVPSAMSGDCDLDFEAIRVMLAKLE